MRTRRGRSLFLIVLVAGIAAITLTWTFAADRTDGDTPKPEYGGEYVEGIAGAPARVNPLFATENAADQQLTALVFAGLTRLDERGMPFPDLAGTWDVSPDGRTYTFTLRPGLLWHDGSPLTASDVEFTYALLQDPGLALPPPLAAVLADATVRAPDDRTVVIELDEAYAPLPAYLTLGILPRHLLDGLSLAELYDSFFNQQPVGAGPFRMERLTPSEAFLAANPAYHFGQPYVQRMELRFYRDEGALRTALDRREIMGAVLAEDGAEQSLSQVSGVNLTTLDRGAITYVYLNLKRPLFQDRRVRQALLHALDRDALIERTLAGAAVRADSVLSPATWAYAPSLTRYEFDVKVAALLLEEAGWRLDSDGVRRRDGRPVTFTLATPDDPAWLAVAQGIADAWNGLGLQVKVSAVGVSELARDRLEARDYDAALWTHVAGPDPDPFEQWHSSRATGEGGNLGGLRHAGIDAVLAEARTAPMPSRRALYDEFQELFAQEVPAIPLYVSQAVYVQDRNLKGVRAGLVTEPGSRFWQVQEWFLEAR